MIMRMCLSLHKRYIMQSCHSKTIRHVVQIRSLLSIWNTQAENCPLLSVFHWLFSSWIFTQFNAIHYITIIPNIKDKAVKINSLDDYQPIALANILSKVLERILLNWWEEFALTSGNQFGPKPKHSTDTCIFALKEIPDLYNRHNTTICMCFIDASKAFDRVNHEK